MAASVRKGNPGKVPLLCTAAPPVPPLPRSKYLVAHHLTVADLINAIRDDAAIPTSEVLVLVHAASGSLLEPRMRILKLDEQYTDDDGYCRIVCAAETSMTANRATVANVPLTSHMKGAASRTSRPITAPASVIASAMAKREWGAGEAALLSPHENLPEGATIASCTFLNPRGDGKSRPELVVPSNGGRVPTAVYLAVVLDMTAVGLVIPLLSVYTRALGGTARFTGVLQATYGLAQLVGANLLGGLSDRVGRRRVMLVSMAGGACGYLCLAMAVGPLHSLWLLLLSRLPIGLLKQSMTASRALVADCTTAATRTRPLMRLGAAVGVGFVLGPAFGGALARRLSPETPPLIAVCLFLLALAISSALLDETAPTPLAAKELQRLRASAARHWYELQQSLARSSNAASAGATLSSAGTGTDALDRPRPDSGLFDLDKLLPLCRALLREAAPHGSQLTTFEVASLLSRWRTLLAVRAGVTEGKHQPAGLWEEFVAAIDGPERGADELRLLKVSWPLFEQTLAFVYLNHKEEAGKLHHDGAQLIWTDVHSKSSAQRPSAAGRRSPWLLSSVRADVSRLLSDPRLKRVRRLLLARSALELAVIMLHSVFADYTRVKFGWGPAANGMAMAASGLISILSDLVLLPWLYKRRALQEMQMVVYGAAITASGLLSTAVSSGTSAFAVTLTLLGIGSALWKSAAASMIFNASSRHKAGQVSGAVDAMEAICRFVAPIAAGMLLESVHLEAPPIVAVLLCMLGGLLFADSPSSAVPKAKLPEVPPPKTDAPWQSKLG